MVFNVLVILSIFLLTFMLAFLGDISINVRRLNRNLDRLINKISESKGL